MPPDRTTWCAQTPVFSKRLRCLALLVFCVFLLNAVTIISHLHSVWDGGTHPNNRLPNVLIPSVLHFNHRINLLTACNVTGSKCTTEEEESAYNVRHIISLHPGAAVRYFDDTACRSAIDQVHPSLSADYLSEADGRFRSDMCRLATLSLYGGLYFDNDLGCSVDMRALFLPNTSFMTITATDHESSGVRGFFQAFVAASPAHPVLRLSLIEHDRWYRSKAAGDQGHHHQPLPHPATLPPHRPTASPPHRPINPSPHRPGSQ